MAFEPVDAVEVRIWGERVGALVLDPGIGYYVFEYSPGWSERGIELAPIHMPTATALHVYPTLPEITFRRLPAMIADSLPDDFGNAIVNAALAREGIPAASITPLDRLAYLGQRGTGALEYHPMRGPRSRKATAIELSELVVAARSAVAGRLDGDAGAEVALSELIAVGTSAGGARAKAVVAWNPVTKELRSGQADAPPGFEQWLLKLDGVGADLELGGTQDYGRIEYGYHRMARAAGITMTDCHLLEENGRAHFMTRRFDRDNGEKVHLQTLCAMAHLDFRLLATHDYAQYLQTIDLLGLGGEARAEGFRRMVFNVYAANCDDHTKNLSFAMGEHGSWGLSPAYDVTHAHNPRGAWTSTHQMAVNGKFDQISRGDLAEVADRYNVPGWKGVVAQVVDAVDRWPEFAAEAGLRAETARLIEQDMADLAPRL